MRYKNLVKKYSIYISVFIGIAMAIFLFLLLGIPTDIIENSFYKRMIPATGLDTFFLVTASLMFGVYAGLSSYTLINKKMNLISPKPSLMGAGGTLFAISCPTCISLLVWLFGAAFLIKYYNPIRPIIGILSIGLISLAVYKSIQAIRYGCYSCKAGGIKK